MSLTFELHAILFFRMSAYFFIKDAHNIMRASLTPYIFFTASLIESSPAVKSKPF